MSQKKSYWPNMAGLIELVKDLHCAKGLTKRFTNFVIPNDIVDEIVMFEVKAAEVAEKVQSNSFKKDIDKNVFYSVNAIGVRCLRSVEACLMGFLRGAPKLFNNLRSEVGTKAPHLLKKEGEEMDRRIEAYKAFLENEEATLEQIVELNIVTVNFFLQLRRKANEFCAAEEAKRKKTADRRREREGAKELLELLHA